MNELNTLLMYAAMEQEHPRNVQVKTDFNLHYVALKRILKLEEALKPFAAFAYKSEDTNNGEWYEDWPDRSDLEGKFIEAAKVLEEQK